jgi:rhodanese-related sulfurtransferase
MIMLREADVRAFAAAHHDGGIVVDVRESHEYEAGQGAWR